MAGISTTLDAITRSTRDLVTSSVYATRQRLDRADTGERSWIAVRHTASARLDLAAADLRRLRDSVNQTAAITLDRATEGLAAIDTIVATSSIEATLSRGFALVLDRQGRVVRTIAAARQARDLTSSFTTAPWRPA